MPAPFAGRRVDSSTSPLSTFAKSGSIPVKTVNGMDPLTAFEAHGLSLVGIAIPSSRFDGSGTVS